MHCGGHKGECEWLARTLGASGSVGGDETMARPGNGRQLTVLVVRWIGARDGCLYEVAWRERPAAARLESETDSSGADSKRQECQHPVTNMRSTVIWMCCNCLDHGSSRKWHRDVFVQGLVVIY